MQKLWPEESQTWKPWPRKQQCNNLKSKKNAFFSFVCVDSRKPLGKLKTMQLVVFLWKNGKSNFLVAKLIKNCHCLFAQEASKVFFQADEVEPENENFVVVDGNDKKPGSVTAGNLLKTHCASTYTLHVADLKRKSVWLLNDCVRWRVTDILPSTQRCCRSKVLLKKNWLRYAVLIDALTSLNECESLGQSAHQALAALDNTKKAFLSTHSVGKIQWWVY